MATGTNKKVILKALGLYTYPNQLSAPEGALASALDVIVDRPGVIEARGGYLTIAAGTVSGATGFWSPRQFSADGLFYANACTFTSTGGIGVIPAYGLHVLGNPATEVFAVGNGGANSSVGPIMSSFRANNNTYVLSGGYLGGSMQSGAQLANELVLRLDDNSGVLSTRDTGCGMPQSITPATYTGTPSTGAKQYGLPVSGAAFPAAASNIIGSSGGAVAYRALLLSKDANGSLVRGPPSGRLIVNATTTFTYGLVCGLPPGRVYAGDIFQLYRSETVAAGGSPSDDCRQVIETIVTSTDVTRGYVIVPSDIATDNVRGAALYTNDTQDGILQAETRPPNAALGVSHKSVAWYGGVSAKSIGAIFTVIGVSSPNWQTGASASVVTVANGTVTYNYTAVTEAAGEDWVNQKFVLYTSGASPSVNLANTMQSLARVAAFSTNASGFSAQYVTGTNDSAQTVVFTLNYPYVSSVNYITVSTSNIAAVTLTTQTPFTTKPTGKPNWLYYSKVGQPEAVPDVNYVQIGSPDAGIMGLASLRDSLFVFKEDGLFRVTGSTAYDIRVELFDATVRMVAGQHMSIATAGNQVFCLTSQGVCGVTETGVNVLSRAIEDRISPFVAYPVRLSDTVNTTYFPLWCAVGAASDQSRHYELVITDRQGFLGTVNAQYRYVYNFINNAWTQYTIAGSPNYNTGICVGRGFNDRIAATTANALNHTYISNSISQISWATAPSFSYCLTDVDDPGEATRFFDVMIALLGSSGITQLTLNFSSDSGAAPVSVTQSVPTNQASVKFSVPRDHAQCSQLNFTVNGPGVSTARLMISSVVVGFASISDRIPSGGRS